MAEISLADAAARLGAVYSFLVHEGNVPLEHWAFPKWMEPKRLHSSGGFGLKRKIISALTATYLQEDIRGVAAADRSYYRENKYEADLRVYLAKLAPALAFVTNNSLKLQEKELWKLHGRFRKPGVEDHLHESAVRIWKHWGERERASNGARKPDQSELVNEKQTTQGESKILPNDVHEAAKPRETENRKETSATGTMFMTRQKLLAAIKKERTALEKQSTELSEAQDQRGQSAAIELSELLAVLAVHPEVFFIIRDYIRSPHAGTERVLLEIELALDATEKLRKRLTTDGSKDDAWGYAPLVVSAVCQLGLHEVPGLLEFTVAMGQMLAKTRTTMFVEAATVLMIGLSIAFTGGAAAIAVGALDLALAGTTLGINLLRMHEQEIAATASDFSSNEKKLADHAKAGDAALSVAGAFLSAVALVGAIRGVVKVTPKQLLSTRPRPPEVLKPGAKQAQSANLKLDYSDHGKGFFPIKGQSTPTKELNRIERGLGDPNLITATKMRDRAKEAKRNTRKRQSQRGLDSSKGRGANPDLELEQVEFSSATAQHDYDYRDHNSFEEEQPANRPEVANNQIPDRGFHEFYPSELSQEASSLPKLEDLPRASGKKGRVLTREQQAYDALWVRDTYDAEIAAWAHEKLPEGSKDPLCPWIEVTPKNPAIADHIVAVERIKQFWGFARLNEQNQRLVLTMRKNYMAISKSVNSSRGSKSFKEWSGLPGQPMSKDMLAHMQALEKDLVVELHGLIDELLKQQQQIQGTVRPLEGSQELGWRLTGDASRGLRVLHAHSERDDVVSQ